MADQNGTTPVRCAPTKAFIVALAIAASAPAALAQDNEGDPTKGASDFSRYCARCHRDVSKVAPDLSLEQPQTLYALDDFLATHHTTDATMRADIIAYLLTR